MPGNVDPEVLHGGFKVQSEELLASHHQQRQGHLPQVHIGQISTSPHLVGKL